MNIEIVIAMVAVLVIPNSCAMVSLAGATIEDDTGLMKVKDDTMNTVIHFLRMGQLHNLYECETKKHDLLFITRFLGLSGSSGPSQSITSVSLSSWPVAMEAFSCVSEASAPEMSTGSSFSVKVIDDLLLVDSRHWSSITMSQREGEGI